MKIALKTTWYLALGFAMIGAILNRDYGYAIIIGCTAVTAGV